ncbi:hypothetical protein CASFOL_006901 [Castilleja foliolosa]|uniref:Uncharacterized protein n=1 Tax=Castilleja foliolosa TaxID=1961234 RepID=A0ABD3E7R8_9LAMI
MGCFNHLHGLNKNICWMGIGTGPWHFLKGRRSSPSNNMIVVIR